MDQNFQHKNEENKKSGFFDDTINHQSTNPIMSAEEESEFKVISQTPTIPQQEEAVYHSASSGIPVYQPSEYAYSSQQMPPQMNQSNSTGPKKPKNKGKNWIVATVAISIVASLILGSLSGALVTSYMLKDRNPGSTQSQSSTGSTNNSSGTTIYTQSTAQGELTIPQLVEKVGDAVVAIDVSTGNGTFKDNPYSQQASGSGVIISSDGYIVTNNHVVADGGNIKIYLKNGDSYEAKIIGKDPTTDLALLKIEASNLIYAQFGDSASLQVGQTAVAIGNPLGQFHGTVTCGIVSALDRELTVNNETMNLLQTDASISPGNSGGALFNTKGEIIGIVNAKINAEAAEGIGFAIPINDVKPIIEEIRNNGYVTGRPAIGVSLIDISTQAMANMYRVTRLGTYIYEVQEGSAAAKAGLQPGDCIVSVNGKEIGSAAELSALVKSSKVGDKLSMVFYRGDEKKTVDITVAEKSAS